MIYFTGPEDYIELDSSIEFSTGSTMGQVECGTISIVDGNFVENPETLFLNLSSSSAEIDVTRSTFTLIISDNDGKY